MDLIGFIGTATVSVDAKGRTNLPRELRKQLPLQADGKVVVTIFADKSLALRPAPEWNRYVAEELEPLARKDRQRGRFVQRITSMAKLSELDAQNRITLTPDQMAFAGISKEVTFAGDGARIRLWNPETFADMVHTSEGDAEGFEDCFYTGSE